MSENEQKKRGRPKKWNVDIEAVEKMAGYGCSPREIADVLGVPYKSVLRDGKDALQRGKSNMKCRLRKAQFDTALSGNPTMQIWLGKQLLNQTESGTFEEDLLLETVEFELDDESE